MPSLPPPHPPSLLDFKFEMPLNKTRRRSNGDGVDFAAPTDAASLARYLDELVKDMRMLLARPGFTQYAQYILNDEIDRVWRQLYSSEPAVLQSLVASSRDDKEPRAEKGIKEETAEPPKPVSLLDGLREAPERESCSASNAEPTTLVEKINIPEHPKCNLIGRILGPRGMTVKQLEAESGCQILIRGRGCVKNPEREGRLANYPGWEHLAEPLHVLVRATDDYQGPAHAKLRIGVDAIMRLLKPQNDEHKRRQLVQLAIIKGTYRPEV